MDGERFISSASAARENPRPLGFAQERLGRPPTDSAQRATTSILDRFRAMLREREEDLRGSGDETPPPPDGNEIVRMYGELLTELTFNSKPIITELTIIAGDQREHARSIAEAVCARIDEVPQDQKLPALYLLDSIVKNIGDDYVRTFAARLPKTFCQAYNDVHSSLHPAMRHLFQTWSQVFPHSTLRKIEDELKFSTPENQRLIGLASMRTSETSQPSHGIHVNPKYLEARRQFENPEADIRHSREVSSGIQVSGHRSFTKYNDHDLDHFGFQPSSLKMVREGSPLTLTLHGSSMEGQEGPFLSSQRKVASRVSPTRIGLRRSTSPQGHRFQMSSPGRVIEATSRSHSGLDFQSHRASESNGWVGRNLAIDDGAQQSVALTTYNKYGRQRQRELIDAYGNYRGKDFLHESLPKIQRVDVNGIKGKAGKMDWQNSEEEEYVWEDMSPTHVDPSKRSRMQSEQSTDSLGLRDNSSRSGIIAQKSDFRRRSWPVPPLKDSTTTIDDRIGIRHYGLGPMNKMYLDDTGSTIQQFRHHESSQHVQEHGSLPHVFHRPTPDNISPKSQGRPFQLPYLVGGVTPSVNHKRHSFYDNSHNAEMPFLNLSSASSDTTNHEMSTSAAQKAHHPPIAPVPWPPAHISQSLQLLPIANLQTDNNKPIGNQQPNFSVPFPQQQFDANGRQLLGQAFQENRGSFIPPVLNQPLSGVQSHGQSGVLDSILPNPIPGMPISSVKNISLHGRAGMPPLPPGPPPLSSQSLPASQNSSAASQSSVSGFSGLISSLMAQGLISLTPQAQSQCMFQNTMGLEFNAELLKIRHESAINAMYTDLPRQCTTCGLRFTCQEDHSNHMDWHVTKNRISKNRKQKPSRKWFVSAKEWLCGAETLGADAVPGFLPTEVVPEKKEDTEMAVPADENQTVCALCGEPFEDFYSDETEEWMYREAVYMNAPNGDIEGLDRSQLGPIVHIKCRSESAEGSGQA
ncbi:polyadenylation and cleavage factor homolog 4 isoform X1 [Dendrobium catenatum]|uniref:polyadenylation and cleavage factor homolog 4 isoform X1 n=1 Tax=Dendrobium catenatum TaxID=906689 RepID=UPI0009F65C22|nr:polyadenylation and cleavage factor homolog 4 isoform X1 [Dendrobium catenatum]